MQLPLIYKKSMKRYFYALGIILITILGFNILGELLGLLSGNGLSGLTLLSFYHGVADPFLSCSFVLMGVYYLVEPYSEFKIGIQNGQSRWQIWVSQIYGVISISIFSWLIYLVGTGFQHLNVATAFGILLLIIDIVVFSYAIGSGFALLSRLWKIIVGIALPTILLILMVQIIRLMVNFWHPSAATLNTLAGIFNWHGSWILFGLLWLAIMLGCSYLFTMYQQLRRD